MLKQGDELDENFSGLAGEDGLMTVVGFGSLLSERSSKFTFPDLQNFRIGIVENYKRLYAHTSGVFFERGIANMQTREFSSLCCDKSDKDSIIVAMFEIPYNQKSVQAFISREHEFRFQVVQAKNIAVKDNEIEVLKGVNERQGVICARNTDENYFKARCSEEDFQKMYGKYGLEWVWWQEGYEKVLPCRVYLRHCLLAAKSLGQFAYDNFLDSTYLYDSKTTIREYIQHNQDIFDEVPPPELQVRYGG